MKHYKIYTIVFYSCLLLLCCEKNDVAPCNNCRIKRIRNYDDKGNEYLNIFYSYEGHLLVSIDYKFTKPLFGAYDSRHLISYSENKVTYIIETKYENNYIIDGKYEISSQDDKISEIVWSIFENGQFIESKKMVYEYSNSDLVSVIVSFKVDGELKQLGKISIEYKNGNIEKFFFFRINDLDELVLEASREYEYVDGKLTNWIYSIQTDSGERQELVKWIFHYSDGLISRIEKLENYFGDWQQLSTPTDYYYDSERRLIKIGSGNASERVEFEEGQCNSLLLKFPEDKYYFEPQF